MIATPRVVRNWVGTGKLILRPLRTHSILRDKTYGKTELIWKKCKGFVSISCGFSRYRNNIYIASLSVGTQTWPFIAVWSSCRGSFRSVVTETSPDEAEKTDDFLNEFFCTIESGSLQKGEICDGIKRLCRSGSGSAMAKLMRFLHNKNIFLCCDAYYILLAAASEKCDAELSINVFKDLLISSVCLSAKSFFNLAKAFANTDDCTLLLQFVEEIPELVFGNGVPVLNRIIFAFAECRQIEKALTIFNHMKSVGCNADVVTYNTVLGILGRAGRVDDMLHELSSMKEVNINPDVVSYNTLLNTLQKFGRLDLCLVFMREMDSNGLMPDLRTYTALIEGFGRSGNVKESLRLLHVMKCRQVKPSIYIYRSLIDSLKKMGKLEAAASLWEEMNSSLPNLVGPKDFKRKNR